jgi:predicted mannosyl-3-phosphoglycerate phosphatase (HAD superfamily)
LSINGSVGYAKLYKAAKKGKRKDDIKLFPNSAETIAVRDAYRKTLDVDPLDFVANNHLLALYGRSSLAIDETARQAANTFLIQFLRPQLVGQYVDLAYIHAKDNKPTEACAFFRFAEAKTDDYPKKDVNDDWARAQAFKQTYNYCLATEG